MKYGYARPFALSFEEAVAGIESALKAEGFGVLCHIDIQAKLREKLGVEFPPYVILAACNPPLAHQVLEEEINLGLLLPCNAVVYEKDGRIWAGVVDAARCFPWLAIRRWSGWPKASTSNCEGRWTACRPFRPDAQGLRAEHAVDTQGLRSVLNQTIEIVSVVTWHARCVSQWRSQKGNLR